MGFQDFHVLPKQQPKLLGEGVILSSSFCDEDNSTKTEISFQRRARPKIKETARTVAVLVDIRVAAVQLEVVHTPRGERICVHLHVVLSTRVPCTRLGAEVLVYTELQAFSVHLQG